MDVYSIDINQIFIYFPCYEGNFFGSKFSNAIVCYYAATKQKGKAKQKKRQMD